MLKKIGFNHIRTKGSHVVLRKGENVCVVPLHSELAQGTLKSVLRQAGIRLDEFLKD
ncbi:MAG: type II toxin-antitoxin system HicA family toxin [Synergistaceae bacterium]|nr:type II toxin-antitoxin system HicA family toxin [Synergistaceae bacterium]